MLDLRTWEVFAKSYVGLESEGKVTGSRYPGREELWDMLLKLYNGRFPMVYDFDDLKIDYRYTDDGRLLSIELQENGSTKIRFCPVD